ncbi:MAG: hypothetical protein QG657_909 [Acidobacteriota bacterium]|nr:hypothetical protein [Acidobacteriota bacterium]
MPEIIQVFIGILAGLIGILFGFFQFFKSAKNLRQASENVLEAEKEAFQEKPELNRRMEELLKTQEGLEERTKEIAETIDEIRSSIELKRLFNLYNKQIEKYHQQTRSRASWSFMFAILSMIAGLSFVIWGGNVLLNAKETIVLAAGGIIASIGGGVSGYITKTFLDVHKLSLNQLNRYFKQPVINDHILMAQRLADDCNNTDTRKQAYQTIIDSIANLIKQE